MKISKIVKETRSEQIPIRFSPTERETVERIAAQEHDYASSFLRRMILKQIGIDGRSHGSHGGEVLMG